MTLVDRLGSRAVFALPAGALAALGHAPLGLWPVSLAGFAWLALVVSRSERPVSAGWLGGLGYFATALHWIVQPFLIDAARHGWMAPFALILLAGGLALLWAAAAWVAARTRPRALGWVAALSLAELARGYILTGFPWALPAYIWADTPLRLASAWVGPFGLTALTLLATALPAATRRPLSGTALGAIVLAAAFAAGWTRLDLAPDPRGTVRIVQPNAPQDEKWDPDRASIYVDRAIRLSGEEGAPDLIVWPESAIPWPLDMAGPILEAAADAAGQASLVTGINRRTPDGLWFNSLVLLDGGGELDDTYDKVHLVPFGEYIPLRIDLLRSMAGFSGFGFTPGEAVRLVDTPLGTALPLICYEAIFPRHGADAGRPDYLLQITNDAWFGTFSGPYQHLDQARFRAAEQGLPLIRAANTGVSAVIDATGHVTASLPLGADGHLDAAMPQPLPPTIYARTGDLPSGVILLLTLVVLIVAGRRNAIANRASSS